MQAPEEEAPADGTMSPVPMSPSRLPMNEEVIGEEDDYRWVQVAVGSWWLEVCGWKLVAGSWWLMPYH